MNENEFYTKVKKRGDQLLRWSAAFAFPLEDKDIRAHEALEERIYINTVDSQYRKLLNFHENIFTEKHCPTCCSQIPAKQRNMVSVGPIIKGMSLFDFKIDTINMKETQQNTRLGYN
ncbi:hypothetical protein HZS_4176 [Henneguya salminicola]|nr:hypothetical protein HZS_4176 [Henneguya salminicola]